ncbi:MULTISPECIES: hypothetical protein [Micromonospora]|uniref:hypothetical protein n=1 Tax=Micromonospora TaxID=1873 RepID=UPI000B86CD76|nr:hypothetical protein [Micromonospora yangpuensis]GGL93948.1 hypothetical protein GCM10012279_09410 [Micromonospora yangpuensis]
MDQLTHFIAGRRVAGSTGRFGDAHGDNQRGAEVVEFQIFEGTNEIMGLIIARSMLDERSAA